MQACCGRRFNNAELNIMKSPLTACRASRSSAGQVQGGWSPEMCNVLRYTFPGGGGRTMGSVMSRSRPSKQLRTPPDLGLEVPAPITERLPHVSASLSAAVSKGAVYGGEERGHLLPGYSSPFIKRNLFFRLRGSSCSSYRPGCGIGGQLSREGSMVAADGIRPESGPFLFRRIWPLFRPPLTVLGGTTPGADSKSVQEVKNRLGILRGWRG